MLTKNSLLLEIFSLLFCVGNFVKSRGATAVSCSEIASQSLKIAKFPVKFPVNREFAWRQVRSALRRQPGSVRFREFPSLDEKGPPNAGFSHRQKSLETDVRTFWAEHSQKSPAEPKKTPVFWRLALETEE